MGESSTVSNNLTSQDQPLDEGRQAALQLHRRPIYIRPQVVSYSDEDILEQIGSAMAQSSTVPKPGDTGFMPDG